MVILSIIIVNWNGGELLRNCLRSIAQAPPSVSYDIVIVDNASTDDSLAWLRSDEVAILFPGIAVHVIESAVNSGFSKANNLGLNYSRSPMLFLLNPDTEVSAGAIDALIACLQSDERIGACGPRLLNTDGSLQHSAWRSPPAAWETIVAGTGLWRLIPRRLRGELLLGGHWNHATRRAVPMLFAAALLVRRATIDQVGGLDERFHMYGEDDEWCLRMTRSGWLLIFEPDAVVVHHGGRSSLLRWDSGEKLRVKLAASFDFQRSSLSRRQVVANLVACCLVTTARRLWRGVRHAPAQDVTISQEIYWAQLKRMLTDRSY